jgi:hypothetical protein
VNGQFNGNYVFTRGIQGKFFKELSYIIGMCVPKNCTQDDFNKLDPSLYSMASNLNWTNVNVEYN